LFRWLSQLECKPRETYHSAEIRESLCCGVVQREFLGINVEARSPTVGVADSVATPSARSKWSSPGCGHCRWGVSAIQTIPCWDVPKTIQNQIQE